MKPRTPAAVLAALCLLAACGGDDGNSSPVTDPSGRTERFDRPAIDPRSYFEDYREGESDTMSQTAGGAGLHTDRDGHRRGRQRWRHPRSTAAGSDRGQHVRRRRRHRFRADADRCRVDVRARRRHRLVPHRPHVRRGGIPPTSRLDPSRGMGQRVRLRLRASDRRCAWAVRAVGRRPTHAGRHPPRWYRCADEAAGCRRSSSGEPHLRRRHVGVDGHSRATGPREVVARPARAEPPPGRHDLHRHVRLGGRRPARSRPRFATAR